MMQSNADRITVERTFTQADFDAFASLSGDDNPIHVDDQFAAASRFGRTVAHGVLLYTVLRGMLDTLMPGGRQADQELKFTAPTFAGEPMRFSAAVVERSDAGVTVDVEITRIADGVATCSGRTRLLAHEDDV